LQTIVKIGLRRYSMLESGAAKEKETGSEIAGGEYFDGKSEHGITVR
jgi:hypothetical protein